MPTLRTRLGPRLVRIAVLAALYYASARLGLSVGSLPGHVAPVWPPAGLALAAVLMFGPSVAPGAFLGALVVNANGLPAGVALAMATGNTLEALVGALLLRRFWTRPALSKPRDVGGLLFLGALTATFVSAIIGVSSLHIAGLVPHGEFIGRLKVWWVGDALGILLVTPLALSWLSRGETPRLNGTRSELVALIVAMGAGVALSFGGAPQVAFVIYPLVAWAALRFGERGAASATFVVAVIAIDRTAAGASRFATGHPVSDLWVLDAFLAVVALTGMLLAAVVNERDRSQRELRESNARLEARVAERTEALRVDRQRLDEAQRIAHVGSFEWDVELDRFSWSDEMLRIFGFDRADAPTVFAGALARVHPDDLAEANERLRRGLLEARPFVFELRLLLPKAVIRWVHVEGQCHVAGGRVNRINGICQDITESRRAAERIRATEERTTRIVEAANEAFVTINALGIVTDWNRQAESTFGWERHQALGQPLTGLIIPPGDQEAHLAGLTRFLATGHAQVLDTRREVIAVHRDGHTLPVEMAVWATSDDNGDTHFHAFLHDISRRQTDKRALNAALDEALEASRLKTAFLANMSHEIRTPMNGVLGMVGLLLDTPLDDEQREYLTTMASSAESLTAIIDDILDVSKIEAGTLILEPRSFALRTLVEGTVTSFAPAASERGIALAGSIEADVPASIYADPVRLRQVISNLLSNAVKFTEHGSVGLSVRVEGWSLIFEVCDTGIGVPSHLRDRLFEPFVQADDSTTRRFGGAGLGLAICRQIATLMSGEVGMQDADGGGARFWLKVPLRFSTAVVDELEPAARPAPEVVPRGRVLVVEDNAVNRKVAIGILEKLGYTAAVAVDGVAAVEAVTSETFDVILMDCQMPRMDGYDATRAIRAFEGDRHTPIVAMTASAMASDRERCLAAGMDDFLAKPVDRELLARALHRNIQANDVAPLRSPLRDPRFDDAPIAEIRSIDHDGAFLHELVEIFREDIARHVVRLDEAIAVMDTRAIRATAHQAKGAAGNLGLRGLSQELRKIEDAASGPTDAFACSVDSLRDAVDAALVHLGEVERTVA